MYWPTHAAGLSTCGGACVGITRDPRGFTISNGKHRTSMCLHPPAQHGHRPSPLTHPHPSALRTSLTPTPIAPLVHRQLLGRTGHRSSSASSRNMILPTPNIVVPFCPHAANADSHPCGLVDLLALLQAPFHAYIRGALHFIFRIALAGQCHVVRQQRSRDTHITTPATDGS